LYCRGRKVTIYNNKNKPISINNNYIIWINSLVYFMFSHNHFYYFCSYYCCWYFL